MTSSGEVGFKEIPVVELISDEALRKSFGVSKVTWWEWRKKGRLPTPIDMGKKRRYYLASDVANWLETRKSGKSSTGGVA